MNGIRGFRSIALVAAVLTAWWAGSSVAERQTEPRTPYPTNAVGVDHGGLVTHVISQESRPHTLVVADTDRKVVAVYHVDAASGRLELKSVRNVTWDLQMLQYETTAPTPQEVRAGLPR